MSTAEKLLAGGSILLLIDSFFPWQSVDLGSGLDEILDLGSVNFNMWQGSGSFFGVLTGLLAIALIVVGVLSMTGSMTNMNMGSMSTDKLTGFLGLGVAGFGLLKFIFALTESPGWGAFVGLVLLVAIGWGAWQKVETSGGFQMGGGTMGGGTMGGGTMGGGTMGGGPPPPSAPPPSVPPPSAPPTEPPPSGGMPPSGSSDM
jgi:hypothetical protein